MKKLQEDSGEPSTDPSSINTSTSVTPAKPRAKKRTSRPRSVTRRKQKPEDDRQASPVIEYSMTDNGIPLEEYKVSRDYGSKQENKGGGGSINGGDAAGTGGGGAPSNSNNANSNGFADSMVGVVNDRQMISDVPDMAGHAQTSVTSLPSSLDATAHHQSSIDGTDHGMTMILTPNPFHHSEASAFQPPPPPQAVVHPPQSMASYTNLQGAGVIGGGVVKGGGGLVGGTASGMVGNTHGGRVGDDILEGMGYLEHRYQLHPDFTLREQQNRSYNIQAVVLRNS